MNVEPENRSADKSSGLFGFINKHPESVDEKIYSWSGLKTKRIKRDTWTISIPKGYAEVSSADDKSAVFVPKKYQDLPTESSPVVITIKSYDISQHDIPDSEVYNRLCFNELVEETIKSSCAGDSELEEYNFTDYQNCHAVLLTVSVSKKDAVLIALLKEKNNCAVIRINAVNPGRSNKDLLQKSLIGWIPTMVFHDIEDSDDQRISDSIVEAVKQGDITGFSNLVNNLQTNYQNLISSEKQIIDELQKQELVFKAVENNIRSYLKRSLGLYADDVMRINELIEVINSEVSDPRVMAKVLESTEVLKHLVLSEKTESDVVTIIRDGTIDSCFSKWEAMTNDINAVFEEENRRAGRIRNKAIIVNQCNEKLKEHKTELSDIQTRKLEELKIHMLQKQYDMEEQVAILESERENTGLLNGIKKKKIDREIDKLIRQIRMCEKPSNLVRGHQYIEDLLAKSRKKYASSLNDYLTKRFPYEMLKQKQFNKFLATYEGYLYTKKAAIFKYIKNNPEYTKGIAEKLAQELGIPEGTVRTLLSELEVEKLICRKTQRFRGATYAALAEKITEPKELSVIRDSNGVQVADEYDEAPELKNSSIPDPDDYIQLEKEIDAFIDEYNG